MPVTAGPETRAPSAMLNTEPWAVHLTVSSSTLVIFFCWCGHTLEYAT